MYLQVETKRMRGKLKLAYYEERKYVYRGQLQLGVPQMKSNKISALLSHSLY
jgi:hypothetical protein